QATQISRQQWSELEQQLRDEIAQQATAFTELQQRMEEQRQVLTGELEASAERAAADRHSIESLQSQVAARIAELEEARRHLTETTSSLANAENTVSQLQLEQQSLQASNEQLAIELESERKRQQLDQEQLARVQQQHQSDKNLIDSLRDEIQHHAAQSAEAQRRELALQQQLETTQRALTSQAAEFEKNAFTAADEQERLWNALETTENEFCKLTKIKEQVESERDRLRENELASRKRSAELEQLFGHQSLALAESTNREEALIKEVAALHEALSRQQSAEHVARTDLTSPPATPSIPEPTPRSIDMAPPMAALTATPGNTTPASSPSHEQPNVDAERTPHLAAVTAALNAPRSTSVAEVPQVMSTLSRLAIQDQRRRFAIDVVAGLATLLVVAGVCIGLIAYQQYYTLPSEITTPVEVREPKTEPESTPGPAAKRNNNRGPFSGVTTKPSVKREKTQPPAVTTPSDLETPSESATPPSEPATPPSELTTPPSEPTTPPSEQSTPPSESTAPPSEATTTPSEPAPPPSEPAPPPSEPTTPPSEPTTPPSESTAPPSEPTTPPSEPATPPSDPTTPDEATIQTEFTSLRESLPTAISAEQLDRATRTSAVAPTKAAKRTEPKQARSVAPDGGAATTRSRTFSHTDAAYDWLYPLTRSTRRP
ncbi:MAG: hypothetical protein RIS70_4066, partial [Planctomycetota bacterium]